MSETEASVGALETSAGDAADAAVARADQAGLEAALAGGADPNGTDRWGVPLLSRAVVRGDLALVECLLNHGAEAGASDRSGNVPLMQACARGDVAIVGALLAAGADPAVTNKWGFGPRDWASWPENASELQALIRGAAS